MTFIIVKNGSYVSTLSDGNFAFSETVFQPASTLTPDQMAQFSVVQVATTPQPSYDPTTQFVQPATPALVNGVWSQAWNVVSRPPPETISDRQFAQVLALDGLITHDEALAWVKGTAVPARIQAIVDSMTDAAAKFGAQMLLSGATQFNRSHPMVAAMGASLGMTSAQIDDIWRKGATL